MLFSANKFMHMEKTLFQLHATHGCVGFIPFAFVLFHTRAIYLHRIYVSICIHICIIIYLLSYTLAYTIFDKHTDYQQSRNQCYRVIGRDYSILYSSTYPHSRVQAKYLHMLQRVLAVCMRMHRYSRNELDGESCIEISEQPLPKQSIRNKSN